MENKKSKSYLIIGSIVLLIATVDLVLGIKYDPLEDLLWFSNTILFLLAFAYILRSRLLMGSILISSIVEIPWTIDFISHVLFNKGIFGNVTGYMFNIYGAGSLRFYIEMNHLLVIPLALYGAYKIGIHEKSYLISSAHATLLNTLTFLFTNPEKNINCIEHLCFIKSNPFAINPTFYFIIWTLVLCFVSWTLNKTAIRIIKNKN